MCLADSERTDGTLVCMHKHFQKGHHLAANRRSGSRQALVIAADRLLIDMLCSLGGCPGACRLRGRVRCLQSGPATAPS